MTDEKNLAFNGEVYKNSFYGSLFFRSRLLLWLLSRRLLLLLRLLLLRLGGARQGSSRCCGRSG
jgi:hypothetical protein